jgi:hypothetical protein
VASTLVEVRAVLPVQGLTPGGTGTVDLADPEVAALIEAVPPILIRI